MNVGSFWDVHAHTPAIRTVLQKGLLYRCVAETIGPQWMQPPGKEAFYAAVDVSRSLAIDNEEEFKLDLGPIRSCLMKFVSRFRSGNWKDPDLGNLDIATLFVAATRMALMATKDDKSLIKLFLETLGDIGGTCIQGDSHRLIHFIVGVSEKNE